MYQNTYRIAAYWIQLIWKEICGHHEPTPDLHIVVFFLVLANQEATLISWLIESGVLKQVKH